MKTITSIIFLLLCSLSVMAMPANENEILANISRQLSDIKESVYQAKQQQDKSERIQFRYDALINDINKIQQGINEKFMPVNRTSNVIEPIAGDYIEDVSK